MLEIEGDIWELAECGTLVITTNPIITYTRCSQGENVMSRGIALQTKQRFPQFPAAFAARLRATGNMPYDMGTWAMESKTRWYRILTLPTKHHWQEKANPQLIRMSLLRLAKLVEELGITGPIHMPQPGCGNGKLDWREVRRYCTEVLNDQFVVVDYRPIQVELPEDEDANEA